MKILYVTHGYPPDQMAGAEVYTASTARGVTARGHDVVCLSPAHRPAVPEYGIVEESVDGVRVLRMNQNYRDLFFLEATYVNPRVDRLFGEILDRERPDIVHVQHTIGISAGVLSVAKAKGLPVAMTLHDFWFHCPRGQRMTPRFHLCAKVEPWRCAACVGKKRVRYFLNWLGGYCGGRTPETAGENVLSRSAKFLPRAVAYLMRETWRAPIFRRLDRMRRELDAADLLLAPSEFMRSIFLERGVPPEKIVFSEYGMDAAPFEKAGGRRPARTVGAPVRFGFIGTLIPNKGADLLVSAFQSLPEGRATLDIFGAGGGPNAARDERRLRQSNRRDDVRFHGRFDNKKIAEILSGIDVLVCPSKWYENAPLTLHESAMAGIAAVTADHGGMKEFAERFGSALTFRAGDAADLLRVLKRIVDDPSVLSTLVPKRPVRTVEDDVDGLLKHYERLIAARRRS